MKIFRVTNAKLYANSLPCDTIQMSINAHSILNDTKAILHVYFKN